MLGNLTEQDLIDTGINRNDRNTPLASSELAVHRAIYRETRARAIVHAHPPYANTLALVEKEIVPRDEWLEVIGGYLCWDGGWRSSRVCWMTLLLMP